MLPLSEFNKAIVALIMSALTIVEITTGFSIPGVSEMWLTMLLLVLNPILVWAVPNR